MTHMGLQADDLTDPALDAKLTDPSHKEDVAVRALGEPVPVVEDDNWVRNTVFLDPSVITAEQEAGQNELRKQLLEEYRVKATANRASLGEGGAAFMDGDGGDPLLAIDLAKEVSPEKRREAADYKNLMMSQFRNRKANGAAATSPSPTKKPQQEL